jgi:penicillin-binding protein 2
MSFYRMTDRSRLKARLNLWPMTSSPNEGEKIPSTKLTAIQYLIALFLVILMSGLWSLQALGAQNYRALAEANRIRKVPILVPRGKVYDREERLLVDNYPSVTCILVDIR